MNADRPCHLVFTAARPAPATPEERAAVMEALWPDGSDPRVRVAFAPEPGLVLGGAIELPAGAPALAASTALLTAARRALPSAAWTASLAGTPLAWDERTGYALGTAVLPPQGRPESELAVGLLVASAAALALSWLACGVDASTCGAGASGGSVVVAWGVALMALIGGVATTAVGARGRRDWVVVAGALLIAAALASPVLEFAIDFSACYRF